MPSFRFSPRPNKASQIQWREWDSRAFLDAKLSDKPVLLSIAAVWCQWCHMMDETTYSDGEIIQHINSNYIPIRVDSNQRPDINQRYTMGGLPTTVFLTPDGDLISGTTYIDPNGMKSFLSDVGAYYASNKFEIQLLAAQTRARQKEWSERPIGGHELPKIAFDEVLHLMATKFDYVYGGFGMEYKSLPWDLLDLFIHGYQLTGNIRYLLIVSKTLDQLRSHPIFDPIDGGFFRHSMTKDWNAPHFGKTLDVNAAGFRTYSKMFQTTDEQSYREAAQSIAMFMNDVLWDETNGVFFASRDADPEYYSLDKEGRESAPKPLVDRTVYTNWNALAASAYLEASVALRQAQFKNKALRVLEFLWNHCWDENLGMCHYWADEGHRGYGLLTDQIYMAKALLDAYQISGQYFYFERAVVLADLIIRDYSAPGGGFYDTYSDPPEAVRTIRQSTDALGNLKFGERLIGQNSVAAEVLHRLYLYTLDDTYKDAAISALGIFADSYRFEPETAGPYALAVYKCTEEPLHIVIVGGPDSADCKALLASSLDLQHPNKLIQVLDPASEADVIEDLGYALHPAPAAYVCYNMTCSIPITAPEIIDSIVKSMTTRNVFI